MLKLCPVLFSTGGNKVGLFLSMLHGIPLIPQGQARLGNQLVTGGGG